MVARAMPSSLGPCDLKNIKPSREEVEKAKRLLKEANAKELRSKMASMASWLAANPDSAVSASRGDERKAYLQAFVVHQMRAKAGTKKAEHVFKKSHLSANITDDEWYNLERLEKKFGENKARKLIESKTLKERACPLTGSWDDDMKEFNVVLTKLQTTELDNREFGVLTSTDASDADLKLLDGISSQASGSGQNGGDPQPEVKQEPMTAKQQEKADFEAFIATIDAKVIDMQHNDLECRQLVHQLQTKPYTEKLCDDI